MSLRAALLHRAADWVPSDAARARVYRASGLSMGRDVFVGEGVLFDKLFPQNVVIGDRVAIGARCIITAHQTTVTARDLSGWRYWNSRRARAAVLMPVPRDAGGQ